MKSITIHGLEEEVYRKIREEAQKEGLSLNRTIKKLLDKALGLGTRAGTGGRPDFKEFLNAWSKEEWEEFQSRIPEFSLIDPGDWQ